MSNEWFEREERLDGGKREGGWGVVETVMAKSGG